MKKKHFFGFEGGEGSGKTTLSKRLAEHFGDRAIWTREPGGTVIAEAIREIVLGKSPQPMDGLSSYLAVSAARHHHMQYVIVPALKAGKIVICDRFHGSSMAYNWYAQEAPEIGKIFDQVNELVTGQFKPSFYFYLDIPVREGLARVKGTGKTLDRFDREKVTFHSKVQRGYYAFFHRSDIKHLVIDARLPKDEVFSIALAEIERQIA